MDVVWHATVDGGKYEAYVQRTGDYNGVLVVSNLEDDFRLYAEPVTLAYGAVFGPDASDVALWEDVALKVIDGELS